MKYIRDGRAPMPESESISKVMSAIRGKNTGPELALRKALQEVGEGGYRLHWKKVPGRPDIAYPGKKVAVFVHGCFWHSCPVCRTPLPKTHTDFWHSKLQVNRKRDFGKIKALEKIGWRVVVMWEHELKNDPKKCAERIKMVMLSSAHFAKKVIHNGY